MVFENASKGLKFVVVSELMEIVSIILRAFVGLYFTEFWQIAVYWLYEIISSCFLVAGLIIASKDSEVFGYSWEVYVLLFLVEVILLILRLTGILPDGGYVSIIWIAIDYNVTLIYLFGIRSLYKEKEYSTKFLNLVMILFGVLDGVVIIIEFIDYAIDLSRYIVGNEVISLMVFFAIFFAMFVAAILSIIVLFKAIKKLKIPTTKKEKPKEKELSRIGRI